MPVHADDLTNPRGDHFEAAAVEIEPVNLAMPIGGHAYVARSSDLEIQLVVGADGQELPAVRLVLREIAENDRGLGRIVQIRFDVIDLRKLGDVQGAVMKDDAIGTI